MKGLKVMSSILSQFLNVGGDNSTNQGMSNDAPSGNAINVSDRLVEDYANPYINYSFKLNPKYGNSNFNLVLKSTFLQRNGDYILEFFNPFDETTIKINSQDIPTKLICEGFNPVNTTSLKSLRKFEGLKDATGQEIDLNSVAQDLIDNSMIPPLIINSELKESFEMIESPTVTLSQQPATIQTPVEVPIIRQPVNIAPVKNEVKLIDDPMFDILKNIKKSPINLCLDIDLPNLEVFKLIVENLNVDMIKDKYNCDVDVIFKNLILNDEIKENILNQIGNAILAKINLFNE